jgi:hypothetical protein
VTPTPAPVEPETWKPHVDRLGEFGRRVEGGVYRLTWGFIDHHGSPRRVTCRVDRRDHEREVALFGYDETSFDSARDARLRTMVEQAVRQRGLASFVRVEVKDGAWRARHAIPGDLPSTRQQRLDRDIEAFYSWLKGAFRREWETVTGDLLAERGLRFDGRRYSIDYMGVARRATGPLADCTRALEAATGAGLRRELGGFLAFFQEIPYELPPATWRGRSILGFYVPTEVLVGHHGDCDSKAVAFAAMWRHLSRAVLLIRVPGHMLLGVEMRPGPDERFVRMGNRYFVLCEVAGPTKPHPGWSDASGWFEYLLIEPARHDAAEGRSLLPDR